MVRILECQRLRTCKTRLSQCSLCPLGNRSFSAEGTGREDLLGALQGPSRPKGSGAQSRPPAPTAGGAVPSHPSSARPRRAVPPVVGAGPGGALPPWAVCPPARARSPCRLRSRSIMMCRCNARAMALESLGRSRSAGMVLPGALGPWAPGSVTDCQTSDRAYREAGA